MNAYYRILMIIVAILGLVFPGALPARAAPEGPDRQFEAISRLIEKADQALDAGNAAEAKQLYGATIAAYRDFATRFPEHQSDLVQFRMSYCRNQLMGLLAPAPVKVAGGGQAPALADELAQPIGQAVGFCREGRFPEAEALMRKLLDAHPDCAPACLVLATVALGKGAMAESRVLLERAIALDDAGSGSARYNLAQLMVREAVPDMEKAKAHYRRALELGAVADPDLEAVLDL